MSLQAALDAFQAELRPADEVLPEPDYGAWAIEIAQQINQLFERNLDMVRNGSSLRFEYNTDDRAAQQAWRQYYQRLVPALRTAGYSVNVPDDDEAVLILGLR